MEKTKDGASISLKLQDGRGSIVRVYVGACCRCSPGAVANLSVGHVAVVWLPVAAGWLIACLRADAGGGRAAGNFEGTALEYKLQNTKMVRARCPVQNTRLGLVWGLALGAPCRSSGARGKCEPGAAQCSPLQLANKGCAAARCTFCSTRAATVVQC